MWNFPIEHTLILQPEKTARMYEYLSVGSPFDGSCARMRTRPCSSIRLTDWLAVRPFIRLMFVRLTDRPSIHSAFRAFVRPFVRHRSRRLRTGVVCLRTPTAWARRVRSQTRVM